MTLIEHYFPDLSPLQLQQFAALEGLYQTWNAQIMSFLEKIPITFTNDTYCIR